MKRKSVVIAKRPFFFRAVMRLSVSMAALWLAPGPGWAVEPFVTQASVQHSAQAAAFVKYTWQAEVNNPTAQDVVIGLVLTLYDAQGQVVGTSSLANLTVPANATATFTRSEPISKADWERVVSHDVAITTD